VLGDDRFAWLRTMQPIAAVDYTLIVFDVRPQQVPVSGEPSVATGSASGWE
jgi:hypothetical protein